MAQKGSDPFNFDDLYKQAGVGDLFAKKTMGDMKKPQPTAPAPAKAQSVAAKAGPAPTAVAKTPAYAVGDLNFDDLMGSKPKVAAAASSAKPAAGDPFDLFSGVEGASSPVVIHKSAPSSSTNSLLDLDGVMGKSQVLAA